MGTRSLPSVVSCTDSSDCALPRAFSKPPHLGHWHASHVPSCLCITTLPPTLEALLSPLPGSASTPRSQGPDNIGRMASYRPISKPADRLPRLDLQHVMRSLKSQSSLCDVWLCPRQMGKHREATTSLQDAVLPCCSILQGKQRRPIPSPNLTRSSL